ncbi:MAG: Flp pilus assembly protein TadB [Planctomycetota bacterium]|jgi:Flp pilus assembly protein TadB
MDVSYVEGGCMIQPTYVYLLVFFSIALLVWSIGSVGRQQVHSRNCGHFLFGRPITGVMSALADTVGKKFSEKYLESIKQDLVTANNPYGRCEADEYIATSVVSGIAGFLFASLILFILDVHVLATLSMASIAAFLGYLLSVQQIQNLASRRRKAIVREFPYFLDLAVMTMGAGSSQQETLEIFIKDNPGSETSEELKKVLADSLFNSTFVDAIKMLGERIDSEEITVITAALVQGEKLGAEVVKTMQEQAELLRFRRSQTAERAAEELKVRLLGPSMMMMASIFILILGPAIVKVLSSGIF